MRAALDPQSPLVAVVDAGLPNENGAGGWTGAIASRLRSSVVGAVHEVPNDRIVIVDLVSRSRFGVPAYHRIVLELEPRKSNALVLRRDRDERQWVIVAAAKQFAGSASARAVRVGAPYVEPPRQEATLDRARLREVLENVSAVEARSLIRLLSQYDPSCTPPLARQVIERAAAERSGPPFFARLLEQWEGLRAELGEKAADPNAPLFCYRKGGTIIACHFVPLTWTGLEASREDSLNALCAQQMAFGRLPVGGPSPTALQKRLLTRLRRCQEETAALETALENAERSELLRDAGEAIYAHLREIPAGADAFASLDGRRIELDPMLSAKANAAAYFRRYKKAKSGLPRMRERLAVLATNKEYWDQLLWELERLPESPAADRARVYGEIAAAIGSRRTGAATGQRAQTRRKEERAIAVDGGATAYVGRSPKDNERLTFVVAAPRDWWFHARGIPGAHVILKLADPSGAPTENQLLEAASLAAGHSRAAGAAKVEVDYTQAKHVHRLGGGRPGLVRYANFKTVLAKPKKL